MATIAQPCMTSQVGRAVVLEHPQHSRDADPRIERGAWLGLHGYAPALLAPLRQLFGFTPGTVDSVQTPTTQQPDHAGRVELWQ